MKTARVTLIFIVLCSFLSSIGLSESKFHSNLGLIAKAHPELAGIETVFVAVDIPSADPNKYSWLNNLESKLIEPLQKTDLVVNPSMAGSFWNSSVLRINLDLLNLQTSQQCVFRVQTFLERSITLPRQRNLHFTAVVWMSQPTMDAVSIENVSTKVTDVVLEQVETFITTYLSAKLQEKLPPDSNDTAAVSVIAPQRKTKLADKQTVAEYNYVASKNSKVFHKADCSSAARIKKENQVSFKTKASAVNTGRRPCRICKP